MRIDDNDEAQVAASEHIEDQESRQLSAGRQVEPVDCQADTDTNPDWAAQDNSLPENRYSTLERRMDIRLSSLEGIRLLPNLRTFSRPTLGTENSLIQPIVSRRFFGSTRMNIANTVPSLLGGITQELTRSLRAIDSSPPILNRLQVPNLSRELDRELQSILLPILRPRPPLVHPKARMAARLGWVVHHTLPIAVLESASEDDLDSAIMTHYKESWTEVGKEIELSTVKYLVDQDSKETMTQALSAHECGLYRLVPRAILTEIERVIRVQLLESVAGGSLDVKGTILKQVDTLPIAALRDLSSDLLQYKTLEKHLYKRIVDERDRRELVENPIPNRHAAVHGLIPYASAKNSLNSIFLGDFVFFIITQIKKEQINEVARILSDVRISSDSGNEQDGSG